ncbi:hypothetical protein [Nocardia crassostreae]|uniref:hypothetical protein n=1 Tax=Nocardia crassostreae TaxID=53428 RepID=UPI00082CF436|nr:hypothetical protein [Nocardia crassostreae]
MLSKKFATTAALLIAALGISAGTAGAAPEAPEAADSGVINYAATNTEKSTIIRTDAGSMVVEDGVFKIKAADGTVVAGTELKFRVDEFEFPIAAEISDRTATLTPEFTEEKAVYKPINLPFENQAPWKSEYDREQAAFNRLKDTIAMGATIGTLTGGIGGAALGCVIGAGVAFAATTPLLLMFGAGPLGGCIVGASLVGFLGTLAGQIFVTAPVAIMAAYNYFVTINQPFVAPAK